jgi:hypothetical protein
MTLRPIAIKKIVRAIDKNVKKLNIADYKQILWFSYRPKANINL